ncbi:hypothetical protein Tco_1448886 [Tanacetum coccineum]
MSVRLADRSFQYPIEIAENILAEVGKFTFLVDFIILEMEEDKEDFDALSIEGTLLEDQIFSEFDKFMAMNIEENSESDNEEIPYEKITFDIDYKIKKSLDEPPTDLELKPLPDHLEYAFLEEPSFLPVIISSQISEQNKNKLVSVLKKHKQAFAWKTTDIPGICPYFCKQDKKPVVQKYRRLNPNMQEVVKKKSLNSSIPKLYIQSLIALGRMPFGLCNAPATFQRCMLAIFHDMIGESVEVIEQLMARSGMDLKMAKTCYHSLKRYWEILPKETFSCT